MPERGIYIFFFNLILSVACRDIRCVTTAKELSLIDQFSAFGKRVERELKMISTRHILRQILLAFVSMDSNTLGEKEVKIRSKSIGRRDYLQ